MDIDDKAFITPLEGIYNFIILKTTYLGLRLNPQLHNVTQFSCLHINLTVDPSM